MNRHAKACGGFTLIELMVAVAIVAIIAAVALPSFQQSMRKSRRADAFAAFAKIQQAQERWRANNNGFSTSKTDLRFGDDPATYQVSIAAPDASNAATSLASGYIVTAIGQGPQAGDTQCRKLSARIVDGNISYAGCFDCDTFTYQAAHTCWSR